MWNSKLKLAEMLKSDLQAGRLRDHLEAASIGEEEVSAKLGTLDSCLSDIVSCSEAFEAKIKAGTATLADVLEYLGKRIAAEKAQDGVEAALSAGRDAPSDP